MIQVKQTGTWYSDNPTLLQKEIEKYMKDSKLTSDQDIIAILGPHAGHIYSGDNAAHSYAKIKDNKYETVILIGPSHYYYLENQIALPKGDVYKTVLGTIPLDQDLINEIKKSEYFIQDNTPFSKEHSTDNHVPFLQVALDNFKIIPMIMGQFTTDHIEKLAQVLKPHINNKTLVVISSDFTHYGEGFKFTPFQKNIKENLKTLNYNSVKPILNLDAKSFLNHIGETHDTICGAMPITLLLNILPKDSKTELLKYSTSSDKSHDYSTAVSYFSIAFKGKWQPQEDQPTKQEISFTNLEKKDLLKLARQVLEKYIKEGKILNENELGINITDSMKKIAGGFVTLHKGKELRGCIGEILPSNTIIEVVKRRAVSAGLEDPRFPPVTLKELPQLDIEISILTPPKDISSYEDFIVGKHGIILEKYGHSAVFLPQVAPEQGWDRETTLSYLAMKAGLSQDDWKKDTKFQVFEAIVFSEKELIKK